MTKEEVIKEQAKELVFKHTSGSRIEFVDVVAELLTRICELENKVKVLQELQRVGFGF